MKKATKDLAKAIKAKLVELASKDKLPLDMTQLDVRILERVIDAHEPSTKEKTIELAGMFLAASGDDVEEQIKRIIAHDDENDLIDNIDGVDVWEKVEYSFTAKQFLAEIMYQPSDWK